MNASKRAGADTFSRMVDSQKRQASAFVADVLRMRGLMPLLMKNRNGGAWTAAEKAELLGQLRTLSRISPYLLLLLLPGSTLLLPAYAWWLDHRREPRLTETKISATDSF
ncbi:MAG: hypothetical protein QM739_08545 [Propionivibrio sp.]